MSRRRAARTLGAAAALAVAGVLVASWTVGGRLVAPARRAATEPRSLPY